MDVLKAFCIPLKITIKQYCPMLPIFTAIILHTHQLNPKWTDLILIQHEARYSSKTFKSSLTVWNIVFSFVFVNTKTLNADLIYFNCREEHIFYKMNFSQTGSWLTFNSTPEKKNQYTSWKFSFKKIIIANIVVKLSLISQPLLSFTLTFK